MHSFPPQNIQRCCHHFHIIWQGLPPRQTEEDGVSHAIAMYKIKFSNNIKQKSNQY